MLPLVVHQVKNYAKVDPESHNLQAVQDELVSNPELRKAVQDYLATEVCQQPRTLSLPQREGGAALRNVGLLASPPADAAQDRRRRR